MKADGSVQERLKEMAKLWRVAAPPHAREAAPPFLISRNYGTRSVEKDGWLERPHRLSRVMDARRMGPWGPRLWLS
jgi:hypothetical protein